MWMSILIVCGNMYAQSCMVITGTELHTSKTNCFEYSVGKANNAITFPDVHQVKPFCQVIPGTETNGEDT